MLEITTDPELKSMLQDVIDIAFHRLLTHNLKCSYTVKLVELNSIVAVY